MSETPESHSCSEPPPDLIVTLSVDASGFMAAVQHCQSTAIFASHPDLTDLDDELDNLYPELGE